MDYLDPKKQFQHRIILLVGYVFVALAIVIATMILVYQAYGFGLGQNGNVIQNGLIFVSSQPVSAQISINGVNKAQTSSRILLPAGEYQLKLSRAGYRDWNHVLDIQGGSLTHYDYPLLFPVNIAPTSLYDYPATPTLTTQSPDKRWLMVQTTSAPVFDIFDLKNSKKIPTPITLPTNIVTKATSTESWQAIEWADDNQHLLLQHNFDSKSEYILVDRQNVEQSINLSANLAIATGQISLRNNKFDQYYVYDNVAASLKTVTLASSLQTALLEHVLAYKSLGSDTVLFVADTSAIPGTVQLNLQIGSQLYALRSLPSSGKYLLSLANYSGSLYVAASNVVDGRVYVYKDPLAQLKLQPNKAVVPIQTLRINNPSYLSFAPNPSQYVIAENGTQFNVFDLMYKNDYKYLVSTAIDAPQTHAEWLDASHLAYVSGGKLTVIDYDGANQQTLISASPNFTSSLTADNKSLYYFSGNTAGGTDLDQASLLAN